MILISLLGKYDSAIFPILYEFKDSLSHHIIIHDDSRYETNKVKTILSAQKKFKEIYKLHYFCTSIKIDEDSYEAICKCYESIKIIANQNFENIYFNGTGGLVSSTIILSNKLLEKGSKFIAYDIFDNGYNIVSKDYMKKERIQHNKNIFIHLLLKGYKILSHGNHEEAKVRKNIVLKLCEDLNLLHSFGVQLQNRSFDKINGFEIIKANILQICKQDETTFIQGGIFEEYIYWLIIDNFDFDEVMFNVKVEFSEDVSNEFDILMIKDNHLHAIECKLRKSVPGEEYIYKLDSVIDFLDDDGKGMIVVVGGENERYLENGKCKKSFSQGTIARAYRTNIKIHHSKTFNQEMFLNDIKKHFFD